MFKTIIYTAASALAVLSSSVPAFAQENSLGSGDTAWILTATALVLFMTLPGLALFYAGLVRAQNGCFCSYELFCYCMCYVNCLAYCRLLNSIWGRWFRKSSVGRSW